MEIVVRTDPDPLSSSEGTITPSGIVEVKVSCIRKELAGLPMSVTICMSSGSIRSMAGLLAVVWRREGGEEA